MSTMYDEYGCDPFGGGPGLLSPRLAPPTDTHHWASPQMHSSSSFSNGAFYDAQQDYARSTSGPSSYYNNPAPTPHGTPHIGGPVSDERNMAGFGARKFAEQQRKIEEYRLRKEREAEEDERRRQEWAWGTAWQQQQQQQQQQAAREAEEAERLRLAAQQREYEEEQRRQYEQEQWRLQEEQRAREEEQRRHAWQLQQEEEDRRRQAELQQQQQYEESSRRHHFEQQQAQQQQVQPQSSPYLSSDMALPGGSRASEYRQLVDETYQQDYFQQRQDPQLSSEGDTSRYTQYTVTHHQEQRDTIVPSQHLQVNPQPESMSSARRSVARATVYVDPADLPKAKCADCHQQISFEDLATHSCAAVERSNSGMSSSGSSQRSGGSHHHKGSSLSPLSPASFHVPLPGSDGLAPEPNSADARIGQSNSPFLDRYNSVFANKSAQPDSGRFLTAEHAYSQQPVSAPPTAKTFAQASESSEEDEARVREERKRQIAAQREAKKRGGAGATADVVLAALRFKQGAENARARQDSPTKLRPLLRSHDSRSDLQRQESSSSSSVSSAQSSLLEKVNRNLHSKRGRAGSFDTSGGQSSTLTPSSSIEHLSSARDSPPAKGSCGRQGRSVSPIDEREMDPPAAPAPALHKRSGSNAERRHKKGARSCTKSDVDIGGIETLMRDLQGPTRTDEVPSRHGKQSSEPVGVAKRPLQPLRSNTTPLPEHGASAPRKSSGEHARKQASGLGISTARERATSVSSGGSGGKSRRRCCICSCSLSSSKTPFVERDGQFFCARDYARRYLPRCRKCGEPVESNAVKSSDGALRGIFHRACFTCFHCDAAFDDGTFYVFDNSPFCAPHYHLRNGTLCEGCGEGIEGTCKQTEGGERYHTHCLTCQFEGLTKADKGEFCQEPLDDFYVINGRRLCDWHAQRTQAYMKKAGRSVNARKRRTMIRELK